MLQEMKAPPPTQNKKQQKSKCSVFDPLSASEQVRSSGKPRSHVISWQGRDTDLRAGEVGYLLPGGADAENRLDMIREVLRAQGCVHNPGNYTENHKSLPVQ